MGKSVDLNLYLLFFFFCHKHLYLKLFQQILFQIQNLDHILMSCIWNHKKTNIIN